MDYYRLSVPIPKQPWLWIRFRITTILLLTVILAMALAWRSDHRRMAAVVYRLQNPGPHYEAAQATGPPNVIQQGDSASAWCPATLSDGKEWLLLEYEKPVVPIAIQIHENYSSGAIVRVTHYPVVGKEQTLWEGTYSSLPTASGGVATLPVTTAVMTKRIKIYLDTTAATGWNEIDAVGIVDSDKKVFWAQGAEASSAWGNPSNAEVAIWPTLQR